MTAIKDMWGMINDISAHSLSMWLKSKTDDEFVVVPREFWCFNSVIVGTTSSTEGTFTV